MSYPALQGLTASPRLLIGVSGALSGWRGGGGSGGGGGGGGGGRGARAAGAAKLSARWRLQALARCVYLSFLKNT
ncbi:hypothetical protein T492DRAFT_876123 [Pavlovales sp. CCMP2436]|nr:hypothetical protein T492DRAFT_876123 [Pavlovales sp. CCMP2436]